MNLTAEIQPGTPAPSKWARRHLGVVRTALVALGFLLVTIAVGASLAAWRLNEEQNATRDQLRLTEVECVAWHPARHWDLL